VASATPFIFVLRECPMPFWDGNQKVETTDHGDFLLVRVTTPPFGVGFYIAVAACCMGIWWFVKSKALLMPAVVLVAGAYSAIRSSKLTVAELRVTEQGIGYPGRLLLWKDIVSLEYLPGGEDGPSGLYAKTGRWGGQFLLKEIGQTDTNEIIDIIFRRFPLVEMAEQRPAITSIFNKPETITLGLSKSDK
jgi:hypothetical protein